MPLHPGKSAAVRSQNIEEMVASGHPVKQAVAAAYAEARKAGRKNAIHHLMSDDHMDHKSDAKKY